MQDSSGFQLDIRCVKCNRLPSVDVRLYEMRNHQHICETCRQEIEQHGKRISWVETTTHDDTPAHDLMAPPTFSPTKALAPQLSPNSLFASLNLPLSTSLTDIETAIEQKMKLWQRAPDSQEKREMIERLYEWQEQIDAPEAFEKYRESLKPKRKKTGLSIGGHVISTLQEFVDACEMSREGWADGERYLRTGQLKLWIFYQLGDQDTARSIERYQFWTQASDFRALNAALYCISPGRPFRLYKEEHWQHSQSVASASSPDELARKCDLYWQIAVHHLYSGSLGFWLEHCRGVQGLNTYYETNIAPLSNTAERRGVGLELLLEYVVSSLPKPHLQVSFNGSQQPYSIKTWDREIHHQPVTLLVSNVTRGYTSIKLQLEPPSNADEPEWLTLSPANPLFFSSTPDVGMLKASLRFSHLARLSRGRTYRRNITISLLGEGGTYTAPQTFPITISTMRIHQGFQGKLWLYGLRGNVPGFLWALPALILAVLLLWLTRLISSSWPHIYSPSLNAVQLLQLVVAHSALLVQRLNLHFLLSIALIIGITSFAIGMGKGHADFDEKLSARAFRKGARWLSTLATIFMLLLLFNITPGHIIATLDVFSLGVLWFIFLLISRFIATVRAYLEVSLRLHFSALLNPAGKA